MCASFLYSRSMLGLALECRWQKSAIREHAVSRVLGEAEKAIRKVPGTPKEVPGRTKTFSSSTRRRQKSASSAKVHAKWTIVYMDPCGWHLMLKPGHFSSLEHTSLACFSSVDVRCFFQLVICRERREGIADCMRWETPCWSFINFWAPSRIALRDPHLLS